MADNYAWEKVTIQAAFVTTTQNGKEFQKVIDHRGRELSNWDRGKRDEYASRMGKECWVHIKNPTGKFPGLDGVQDEAPSDLGGGGGGGGGGGLTPDQHRQTMRAQAQASATNMVMSLVLAGKIVPPDNIKAEDMCRHMRKLVAENTEVFYHVITHNPETAKPQPAPPQQQQTVTPPSEPAPQAPLDDGVSAEENLGYWPPES